MKKIYTFFGLFLCAMLMQAQYNFPECSPEWSASNNPYKQGQEVSYEGLNYKCKYYTNDAPGAGSWQLVGPCGDGGLGPDYAGKQRIIGYLPTWVAGYDIENKFNPEVVTNLNISFLMFKQNNNNYNSADFASISFDEFQERKVDSVLNDLGVLQKSKAKGVKVSVALGGATDYAFLWLMTKYYNNDAKIDEIATLIANYVKQNDIDGIDLDMECWWADKAISGTKDQGGRIRGSKWGDKDRGAHPAGIGLTKLSKSLRAKMPNKLITAAVFGTSWYGNNYDDGIAKYMDWIGLMSYDFTGSWDKSPEGPHSSLYKVKPGTYPKQTADNPIYSAEDALEYWMGFAPPAWNHSGGFNVPKSKLAFGLPVYGYDFSEKKPDGGNGAKFVPYKDIVKEFPNAATSYNPKDPNGLGGYIGENGKKIYYNTPKMAAEKAKYSKQYGHQGLIVWELTQDVDYNSSSSILKAINGNIDINSSPVVVWNTPSDNQVIEQKELSAITLNVKATDSDGTVQSFVYKHNGVVINATRNGDIYTASFTPDAFGEYTIVASATDDKNSTTKKRITFTVKKKVIVDNISPVVVWNTPTDNQIIEQKELSAITLKVNATDEDGSVQSLTLEHNGLTINTTNDGDMYTASFTPDAFGEYTIVASAADDKNAITKKSVTFTVKEKVIGANTPPVITSVEPKNTSIIKQTELSSIVLKATVTDDVEVSSVKFMVNNVAVSASRNGDQYTASWTPNGFGEVTFAITAMDNKELKTETSVVFEIKKKDIIIGDCTVPAWEPGKVYAAGGEEVSYEGNVYKNKWWSQNETPGSSSVWEFVSKCGGDSNGDDEFCGLSQWASAIAYNSGDQVYYEQKTYKAQWWTKNNIPDASDVWSFVSDCSNNNSSNRSASSDLVIAKRNNEVQLQVTAQKSSEVRVDLYDFSGKHIRTLSINEQLKEGVNTYLQDISGLDNGLYIYKISVDGNVYTEKIIKQ